MKKRILLGAFLFAGTAFGFAKTADLENSNNSAKTTVEDTCIRTVRYTTTTTITNPDGTTTTESTTIQYSYEVPCLGPVKPIISLT